MPNESQLPVDQYVRGTAPLRGLELRNFRAFERERVELAPITIFVGPNNAGKSSILSALRLMAQTLQNVDPSIPLVLADFGTYKDLVFGNRVSRSIGIRLEFLDPSERSSGRTFSFDVSFGYRAMRREVILQSFSAYDDQKDPIVRTTYSKASGRQVIQQVRGFPSDLPVKKAVRFNHFLPRFGLWRYSLGQWIERVRRKSPNVAERLSEVDPSAITRTTTALDRAFISLSRLLADMQYLGPFRPAPSRFYSFSGEHPSRLDIAGNGATDILRADYFRRGSRKRELSGAVERWLRKAEIAKELRLEAVSDRHYDVKLRHPVTGELENLADVGFGASQILPVVTAGYNLPSRSLFLIEQPEIHLHPRAQSELGDFFVDLYEGGIQSIIETHSEHLILRLQKHVASGLVDPADVAVNYVDAMPDGKKVTRMSLNENGIFTKAWPRGFFEERLEEALDLARAPLTRNAHLV